jgi:acyl-CoA thioesterase
MSDQPQKKSEEAQTFGGLIGIKFLTMDKGHSILELEVRDDLKNPHGVLHGGVIYTLADTGMGAALYPSLGLDELCATVEIKIVYFRPVASGTLTCETKIIKKGNTLAFLESEVKKGNRLIAKAMGTYSIFKTKKREEE